MTAPDDDLDASAAAELDATDEQILRAVAGLYSEVDPVPPNLADRIAFGISLDALQADIAELERGTELVGVRSGGSDDSWSVTFSTPTSTIMVTVSVLSADAARIDGYLAPGALVAVELRATEQVLTTVADEDGRFVFESVPRGFAQFVVRPADSDGRPAITPSIEI